MFTQPAMRGQRIGALVVTELQKWAEELGYNRLVLETGDRLPSAIQLYTRLGYTPIPKYGQYVDYPHSVCMGKDLRQERGAVEG